MAIRKEDFMKNELGVRICICGRLLHQDFCHPVRMKCKEFGVEKEVASMLKLNLSLQILLYVTSLVLRI